MFACEAFIANTSNVNWAFRFTKGQQSRGALSAINGVIEGNEANREEIFYPSRFTSMRVVEASNATLSADLFILEDLSSAIYCKVGYFYNVGGNGGSLGETVSALLIVQGGE